MSIQFDPDSTVQIRAIVRNSNGDVITNTNSFEITIRDLRTVLNGGATPNATTTAAGSVLQAAAQANSAATDVAGVNTVLNSLLTKLRASGALAN